MVRTFRLVNVCCQIHKSRSITGRYQSSADHWGGIPLFLGGVGGGCFSGVMGFFPFRWVRLSLAPGSSAADHKASPRGKPPLQLPNPPHAASTLSCSLINLAREPPNASGRNRVFFILILILISAHVLGSAIQVFLGGSGLHPNPASDAKIREHLNKNYFVSL